MDALSLFGLAAVTLRLLCVESHPALRVECDVHRCDTEVLNLTYFRWWLALLKRLCHSLSLSCQRSISYLNLLECERDAFFGAFVQYPPWYRTLNPKFRATALT